MRLSVVLPVKAPTPFLRAMTEFCIRTMRAHADEDFELIVCEVGAGRWFDPSFGDFIVDRPFDKPEARIDQYHYFDPPIGGVRESNVGIRSAKADFIVTTGNDVIVPQGWDSELLRVFEERPHDCGLAALSAYEPGAIIGPPTAANLIVEGMYSPFNMFRKGWEYDEAFQRVYQDSDLVLRMCEKGLRTYRSCRKHVHHLLKMTNDAVDSEAHRKALEKDEELFYSRWGNSPLAMFGLIRSGSYAYGHEFESFMREVGRPGHPANRRR